MDLQLAGKTALVSGSTAGIGYSIALALAAEGAHVTINGRTAQRVDDALARLRTDLDAKGVGPAGLAGIAADLGSAAGVEQLTAQVERVDILINNVGIFEPKPFGQIADAEWTRFFEVNVLSGVRLSRRYLPGMMDRGWGKGDFHLERIGPEHAFGDDPLRGHQDRAVGAFARACPGRGGHGRDGQRRFAGSHALRRSRHVCRADGARPWHQS